ncbi:MAG: hypothetical protein FWE70_08655, partial [Oscillospiraceae bacterium]|nr:hypothetical protein [Oscillospiraceae bacterium]
MKGDVGGGLGGDVGGGLGVDVGGGLGVDVGSDHGDQAGTAAAISWRCMHMAIDGKPRMTLLCCGEGVYPRERLTARRNKVEKGLSEAGAAIAGSALILADGDVAPAREALRAADPDLIVVCFVSWHITSHVINVIKGYAHVPLLAWSLGGETDAAGKLHSPAGAAAITAFLPAAKALGFRCKAICESPDEPHRFAEALAFAGTAKALRRVRGARVGLVGYADMGLYTCAYDKTAVMAKLGVEVEDYFSYEIG